MANSDRRAALKGVNDLGDLVLEADGEIFLLEADESVERAVLSAAQIRRENEEKPEAKQSGPLPISAIQALIRSGASVSQTARDFSIDDALVRRFAKPVETEKQYAIEQFLQAACPADTRGRTIQEVIFDTLSSTRANAKTIEWTAVRRNREPWRIKATFEVNEKITRAEDKRSAAPNFGQVRRGAFYMTRRAQLQPSITLRNASASLAATSLRTGSFA